jgi:hypothetical protein
MCLTIGFILRLIIRFKNEIIIHQSSSRSLIDIEKFKIIFW